MFRGSTLLALDGKGRLSVPAKYRERLSAQCGGHLMLTVDPTNGCLLLYPYPEFEILERQINGLPGFNPLTQQLKLLVIGSAEEIEPDGAGRILDIQPEALHQRVGVILGSREEVERLQRYHQEA